MKLILFYLVWNLGWYQFLLFRNWLKLFLKWISQTFFEILSCFFKLLIGKIPNNFTYYKHCNQRNSYCYGDNYYWFQYNFNKSVNLRMSILKKFNFHILYDHILGNRIHLKYSLSPFPAFDLFEILHPSQHHISCKF